MQTMIARMIFFYLPIDFKNRCNVGYAFINFVNPEHIIKFSEDFQGHRWKNFNSGKVCGITYARIQGLAAMITRFQNSVSWRKMTPTSRSCLKEGRGYLFQRRKKGMTGTDSIGNEHALTRKESKDEERMVIIAGEPHDGLEMTFLCRECT